MKKFILIALFAFILAVPNAAYADFDRDHYHQTYNDWHEYKGWTWGFPPSIFPVVQRPPCQQVNIQRQYTDGVNVWLAFEAHTECLNQYGEWELVN